MEYSSQEINPEYIKVRWREPYVSHALNRSKFGVVPVGIYSGFGISAVGYRTYRVNSDTVLNIYGNPESYNEGAHNAVSGYSVAVHQDLYGHNTTVSIPNGAASGYFDFDFTGTDDAKRIFVIDVDYFISNNTQAQVIAVDESEVSGNPHYLVIGVANIPSDTVSASLSDIDYADAIYPRTYPFATENKYGFMSPAQAKQLATALDSSNLRVGDTSGVYADNVSGIFFDGFNIVTSGRNVYVSLPAQEQPHEYVELITATSGVSIITSDKAFNSDNDIKDIKIELNGVNVLYSDSPDPMIHGATKISDTQIQFLSPLGPDKVVTIRFEGGAAGGGGGMNWAAPVNSNIEPLTDGTYSFGMTKRFKDANFSGDIATDGDVYIGGKLNVSGGIDPIYLQLNPVDESQVPVNSIFMDINDGNKFKYKDDSSFVSEVVTQGTSGINPNEFEYMQNNHNFDIEAPKAVSIVGSGDFFELTDFEDPDSVQRFFGILTENVSAFGTPSDADKQYIQWRGKVPLAGYINGSTWVSGLGEIVQDPPSVSGQSLLNLGIVKQELLFLRPMESLLL